MAKTEEEAQELLAYDKAVEAAKAGDVLQYDLPPDKAKVAQKYAHTGTRKAPMVLNLQTRQRKPNATKRELITALETFLREGSEFDVTEVKATNPEREVLFKVGKDWYTVTLTYKRNMNKAE